MQKQKPISFATRYDKFLLRNLRFHKFQLIGLSEHLVEAKNVLQESYEYDWRIILLFPVSARCKVHQ